MLVWVICTEIQYICVCKVWAYIHSWCLKKVYYKDIRIRLLFTDIRKIFLMYSVYKAEMYATTVSRHYNEVLWTGTLLRYK